MKKSLLLLAAFLAGVAPGVGQGTMNISPVYVAGYARDFLIPVDNGLYYGALYGAVSNFPAPVLTPIYPNTVLNNNWDGIPVEGSHLTFPNPLTLGFPAGTHMLLQVQVWVAWNGPGWTHYNSPAVLVTLDSANPPVVNFGTVVVPLLPEPSAGFLFAVGFGLMFRSRRWH